MQLSLFGSPPPYTEKNGGEPKRRIFCPLRYGSPGEAWRGLAKQ